MKKNDMIKNLVMLGIIASGVLVFGIVHFQKNKNLEDITKYVNNNYKELDELASNYMKGNKGVYPEHISKIEVYEAGDKHDTIVQFTYKKDKNIEYGFYYSVVDRAESFKNVSLDLLELGGDKWMWSDSNGSEGITAKIRSNWYYYKVKK